MFNVTLRWENNYIVLRYRKIISIWEYLLSFLTATMHEFPPNRKASLSNHRNLSYLPKLYISFSLIQLIYGFFLVIFKGSYSNSNFRCKKNAEIITFCWNISHGLTYQVMSKWSISGTWLLWDIPTFIWKQEEIWARWLLSLRSVI